MKKLVVLVLILQVLLMINCESLINSKNDYKKTEIDQTFNFSTTQNVEVKVITLNEENNPVSNVKFDIVVNNQVVATGITNSTGVYDAYVTIPANLEKVTISTNNLFYYGDKELEITNGTASFTYNGFSGENESVAKENYLRKTTAPEYTYLGTYDAQGVPDYLVVPGDNISNDLITYINDALPEGSSVPNNHPEYIVGTGSDCILKELADVWVTFVHEDAGYQNSLGFYTYNNNNPPTSIAQIAAHNIIFPNASRVGSGGGLVAGNKVYLGRYPAGTGIGWFNVSNGWNGTEVGDGNYMLYSNPDFNDSGLKHNVLLLYNEVESKIILGFEDIERDEGSSDQDFNDVLFTIASNPPDAIEIETIYNPGAGGDDDGDGVTNGDDDYPNDADKAFNNIISGTLAFEDLWPSFGDYDFNDMVVNYEFNRITKYDPNTTDPVTYLEATFSFIAAGATLQNGFGVELSRLNIADIESVSGVLPSGAQVQLEGGQSHPVIIVSENINNDLFNGKYKINTIAGTNLLAPSVAEVKVEFKFSNENYTLRTLGTPPYNPFIIVGGNGATRKEIHLVNIKPTDKGDESYFGTLDDNSDPTKNIFYKDAVGMPWALNLPVVFSYPVEDADIRNTYLNFDAWAESGGQSNTDWYLSSVNNDSIYSGQ